MATDNQDISAQDMTNAGLTEEEIAALNDPTLNDEGQFADDDDAEGEQETETTETIPVEEPAPAEESKGEDTPADNASEGDKAAVTDEKPQDTTDVAADEEQEAADIAQAPRSGQLPNWEAPENVNARLKDIETKRDDIAQKFDDGELTAREMRQQDRILEKQSRELETENFKAQLSSESNRDTFLQNDVPAFMQLHGETYPLNSSMWQLLNFEVAKLQEADGGYSAAHLTTAHDNLTKQLGRAPSAKADPNNPKPKPTREIPPTLAHVPSADGNDNITDDGQFAHIDRLNGEDKEAAIAKLSESDLDAYLEAAEG